MHKEEKHEDALDKLSFEVKKLEEEAELIVKDAENKKQEIIATAKSDALSLLAKKQSEFEEKKDEKIRLQKLKIDAEKTEIAEHGKKDISKLETKSRKNIPKASEVVLKKLEDKIIGEF